jgi:hypothetical protein
MAGWVDRFYEARAAFLRPKIGWGVYIVALALLLAGSASFRLGFVLLFVVAYFGGYSAIQFQTRHHFHLEFITWWAFGFVVHQLVVASWRLRHRRPDRTLVTRGAVRSAVFAITATTLVVGGLGLARWYQRGRASQLFDAYVVAAKVPLALPGGELKEIAPNEWPQFVEVDLNEAACGPKPAVTFRYHVTPVDGDLSRTFTLNRRSAVPGVTRVFLPVFKLFKGLEFSDDRPGCVVGAYTLADLRRFPLLLGLTLPPDWRARPLSQRLQDWEHDPSGLK